MIKNQLYPYIEKYINEYLLGFSKEQLNVGLMNGSIMLEKLFIRPDTTNEKLDTYDIPIWIKVGTIKKIQIGCSLMNFLGDNPLEIAIEDVELIICPSFKWIVRNLSSFINEKEMHFKEQYDGTDNNSHDIFGQRVNLYDSSLTKKKEDLFKIFNENIDTSKIANVFNKLYTKALKFYYQKNYLIKVKIKNTTIRFEDDFFNYFGKSVFGIRIPNIELSLSVDGVLKKNSFKVENVNFYYEPIGNIKVPSKFFLSNVNDDGKINIEKYYENIKNHKLINDVGKEIILLKDFNCMGNFGIKAIEGEKVDFFSKNVLKKYNFFIQIATNEIQLNIYPDFLNKLSSFEEFVKSFYVNDMAQDFKPMRKPYIKTSELVIKYNKDETILRKRRLVVRDWFFYMIWFNRIKKAMYGLYYKNMIQEEFSRFYNMSYMAANNTESDLNNAQIEEKNLNDSIELKKGLKKKKEVKTDLNPDNIIMTVEHETLIKGLNLNLYNDKDYLNIKINGIKNSINIDKEKGRFLLNFKNLIVSSSNKVLIDKSIDEKLYQRIDVNSNIDNNISNYNVSNANTEAARELNDDESENKSKNQNTKDITKDNSSKKIINFKNYNSNDTKLNPKLMILNETLEKLTFNDGKNSNNGLFNKNNSSRSGNVLKNILSNIPDEENHLIHKEKRNKQLSEMINEFNKSYIKKSNLQTNKASANFRTNSIHNGINQKNNPILFSDKNSNKIVINQNEKAEKIILNLLEISADNENNSAFSFSYTKKIENLNKVSDIMSINFGFVRMNYLHEYLINALNIFLPFKKLLTALTKLKNSLKIDFNIQQELHLMRKYMWEKFTTKETSDEINKFRLFLKDNIELVEGESNKNHFGYFGINYMANVLNKKNFDFSLNVQDILALGFDKKPSEHIISISENTSKVKFPKINFKFLFSKDKIFAKLFDFEFQYQNTSMLTNILNQVYELIIYQYKATLIFINPVTKKIITELFQKKEKEKKEFEELERKKFYANNNDEDIPYLMNIISNNITSTNSNRDMNAYKEQYKQSKKNSKESIKTNPINLKNFIENNLAGNTNMRMISHSSFKTNKTNKSEMDEEYKFGVMPGSVVLNNKNNFNQKLNPNHFSDSDHLKSPNSIKNDSGDDQKNTVTQRNETEN